MSPQIPSITAFIFDFDGVILDTESSHLESWEILHSRYGIPFSIEEYAKCTGTISITDPFEDFAVLVGLDVKSIEDEFYALLEPKLRTLDVLPGVTELIAYAHSHEIKVALASSSPYEWIKFNLADRPLFSQFDTFVNRENVQQVKPSPEIFLKSAERLGVSPNECIVFEDSMNGLIAAKAAGMYCVTNDGCFTVFNVFDLSDSDLHVKTLADYPPLELIHKTVCKVPRQNA